MEEIGELIGKGFGIWKRNLSLCIPFLLSFALSVLVIIPVLGAFVLVTVPLASLNSTTVESVEEMQELFSQMEDSTSGLSLQQVVQIMLLFVILIVLLSLVSAFFTAGAIGMARQALDKKKTDTRAMWSAGREHFLNMFIATILMNLMIVAGLIFIAPGIATLPSPLQAEPQAVSLLVLGVLMLILYVFALSLALAAAPYALVVDKIGALAAIKASISFFRYNKFDVLVLWLVVVALSLGLQMIGGSFSAGESATYQPLSVATGLINILVLSPLSTVWWTRLYMDRKGLLLIDDVREPW
ncbi:MAG: hypothetical protein A4E44_00600 [Methanosaeta sp. PtaB.Bin018]|nr:MAG: hypothetical protein A4E44_00600 [Methanosaeta sp. PtaB.Bin018]OPY46490.1 MAG: hypothetical protein A4E46_00903 [Methanosaeta sp. PtaU1.Bin016]